MSLEQRSLQVLAWPGANSSEPSIISMSITHSDEIKQRRLVEFKDGCRYGKFGKTKAYELIAREEIKAYKMGGKTLIDLDSIDEYHASLPRVESRAMI